MKHEQVTRSAKQVRSAMAEIETLQDVSFMLKGRIITSISGMFFKREWPTRVETVVEEGRTTKISLCILLA